MVKIDGRNDSYRIWDVAARRPLWTLNQSQTFFSPDSRFIAAVRFLKPTNKEVNSVVDLRFDLINARTGRVVHSLRDLKRRATSAEDGWMDCAFSADGRQFRVASPSCLRSWNVTSGRLSSVRCWVFPSRFGAVDVGSFLPSSDVFITSTAIAPFTDILFDGRTAKFSLALTEESNGTFDFSPNGFLLWSRYIDRELYFVVRVSDGKLMWESKEAPTFSPDGKFAYICRDNCLEVLDAHTGRKLKTLPGPTSENFAPSPDGNWLYEARDGKIWKWRAR